MKFLFALAFLTVTTCSSALAGSPTIAVLTDGFGTGVGSPARANTPTGASTGSYGPPNSDWGVGNGWIDPTGSTGAVPGTGWNIAGTYATTNQTGKPNPLWQDPAYTPGPNEAISATFVSATNTNTPAYGAEVRGVPNSDAYVCYYSNSTFNIVRSSGGNFTVNNPTSGATSSTPSITVGHNLTVKLTATGDGSANTALTCTLTDQTSSTLLSTLNATDTTTELQSGGRVGIYTFLATGTTQVSQATVYSDTPVPFQVVYLGFGPADSLTYGLSSTLQNAPDVLCRMLNVRQTTLHFVPVNMGFSAATTALWQNGNASGYMAATVQNYNALGVKFYFTTLGGNDALQSVTGATWLSNYQAAITYLNSQVTGATGLFNLMTYFDWVRYQATFGAGSAATLPLLRSYPYQSLTGVKLGDTTMNTTFQQVDYFGLTDGGHPADQAVPLLAFGWLMPYLVATNQIGGAPSASITFVGH